MSAIIKAMLEIQRDIHSVGIGKLRQNTEQKFKFRGIDDALMAFAPLLTKHGVLVTPRYSDLNVTSRPTKSGGTMYNATLAGVFTFVAEDGSERVVGPFYGEANDSGDKAISKATSVAFRNTLFVTFSVPHEPAIGGDPDGIGNEEAEDTNAAWLDALAGCADEPSFAKLKAELVTACGGVDAVPALLRTAFVSHAKKLKAAA